nr:DNA translocase FtsK [Vogesella sp. LIG4]
MPLSKVRQFEIFTGASFISEYLCFAQGNKVVIEVPAGKKAAIAELAEVQGSFAEAMALLVRFYERGGDLEETVFALSKTLSQLVYQRENVLKTRDPLYEDAVSIVRSTGKASISSVQRHLRIGYNQAARLIENMEVLGVVSPMHSDGNRTVYA